MTRPRSLVAVLTVLGVALAVRSAIVLTTPPRFDCCDAQDYDRHGVSIAEGRGYPTSMLLPGKPSAYRSPAYPYALAAVYWLSGTGPQRFTAARLAQAALGSLSVGLLGLIALRLWGRRVALLAVALAAVYPPLAVWTGSLLSETLVVFLVVSAVLAALAYRREKRIAWAAVAGALCGIALLARGNGLVLLLPMLAGIWMEWPRVSHRTLAAAGVLCLSAGGVVAPWVIRNALVLHAFVPVSTQTGFGLIGTYNPLSASDSLLYDGRRGRAYWRMDAPEWLRLRADASLSETELDRRARAAAMSFVREHPAYVARVVFWNLYRMADLEGKPILRLIAGSSSLPAWTVDACYYGFRLLAPLALLGAFTVAARRAPGFVWLTPVAIVASFLPFWGTPRYRATVEPFLVLLAALALDAIWERLSHRRRVRMDAAGA